MSISLDSETFFSKKVLIPLGLIIGIIILIMVIIGASSGSSYLKDTFAIENRITNLTETINTNREKLKSSSLRAATSTLVNVLASTTNAISPITSSDEYQNLSSSTTEEITNSQSADFEILNASLENARLNARLDPTYATEIAYQIIILIQLEQTCIDSLQDDSVKSALTTAQENLTTLYTDFQNYKK